MSLLSIRFIITSFIPRREILSAYAGRLIVNRHRLISLTTFSNTKLNSNGESASQCLSPALTSISCDVTFAILILIFAPLMLVLRRFYNFFWNSDFSSCLRLICNVGTSLISEIFLKKIYKYDFWNYFKMNVHVYSY